MGSKTQRIIGNVEADNFSWLSETIFVTFEKERCELKQPKYSEMMCRSSSPVPAKCGIVSVRYCECYCFLENPRSLRVLNLKLLLGNWSTSEDSKSLVSNKFVNVQKNWRVVVLRGRKAPCDLSQSTTFLNTRYRYWFQSNNRKLY